MTSSLFFKTLVKSFKSLFAPSLQERLEYEINELKETIKAQNEKIKKYELEIITHDDLIIQRLRNTIRTLETFDSQC